MYIPDLLTIPRKVFNNGPLSRVATVDFVNTLFHIFETIFLRERESKRACMSGERAVREGESFKQASHPAQSLRNGAESHSCEIMT